MAFGFPASFEVEEELSVSRLAARDAVVYAFDAMGWNYVTPEPDVFHVKVSTTLNSWGERFIVSLSNPGKLHVKSSCLAFQLFDWGKNKQNVTNFLTLFSSQLLRDELISVKEPAYLDETGKTPIDRVISQEDES